jgi:uroporphyrinogen III methyltransferase/synthase
VIVVGEVTRFRETLAWFEKRALFGRRVLVARAEGQRGELLTLLRQRGAEPVPVALLAFESPADPEPLERALGRAARYDWIVFTSANAVRFSVPHLATQSPQRVRVACVGSATAAAARKAGLRVDVVPKDQFLPADLAAEMAVSSSLRGARILFPRAAKASDTLSRGLEGEGARVDAVTAYRTFIPAGAESPLRRAIKEGLDAMTLTSPSTVDHLVSLLGATKMRNVARELTVACIGPTTAGRLRDHGLEPDVVCGQQTSAALVEELERWFEEHEHGIS